MAPILSLTKERMDAIKASVNPCLVSVWQNNGGHSPNRIGFIFDYFNDKCAVLTLNKGLQMGEKVSVRFAANGAVLDGSMQPSGQSKLAAIIVDKLTFTPNPIEWSLDEAKQCDPVVHFGFFDKQSTMLGLSSGSVGLAGHSIISPGVNQTTFAHCCSRKECTIGAPVCNLKGQGVGINIFETDGRNLFFALDLQQIDKEIELLFGRRKMRLFLALGMDRVQAGLLSRGQTKAKAYTAGDQGSAVKKRKTA